MILIVWIPLITVVFGVLVWLLVYHSRSQVKSTTTAPSGYNHLTTSALHGQSASVLYQLNAPVPPENATLSSQTGTPGPVPSSVPPTTSSSSSHISTARPSTESPLKSSSEGKPSTSTAGSTRTSPTPSEPSSPSLGRLSAPTLAASSPASSPPTTSTSLPSAASSSAAVGPSSARESGLSTPPSSDTSPSTSPGENSSPVPETSFPAPAGTASPSSDAASDVLSPTSLSTGASATAVHTTISTPAPRPKWQRNRVWVDCTVKKLHNKDTCYAKIYYFPWRAVYPHIIYGNTVYVFDLKRGQVAKLKEKNLYVPVLEELAKQIKHRRQELLHEGQSADRFRINLRSYLADLEHL
ncbi:hypothetical protein CSUI_010022 [Cystoisospora suis]|uniref:Transmembrane protein n=1 Tax=Cystoisospora suis TaxID=483139 RepID=A0A2C6KI38_9APIC|nr:hypothetical protein CSUI_010022 [Cystoisospora suis]